MSELKDIIVSPKDFPYCPGCGHTSVNMALAKALLSLDIPPDEFLIVSDIGCVGLVDRLFNVHTVHTLHGRSTAVAAGVKMADEILFDNKLKTVVMIGDGGATIGLLHLLEAARMNVDLTCIIHNNFLYGMTGGQHSALTPENFVTSTTKAGNPFPPLNLSKIFESSGAGFVARLTAQDRELVGVIKKAIEYPGFSLIEVFELCTGYATRYNSITGKDLEKFLEDFGGRILKREERENFKAKLKGYTSEEVSFKGIREKFESESKTAFSLILAGSAGEGIQSAGSLFATSAILSGFEATQRNDNPVTVSSGFSISELIISPDDIKFFGIEDPDYWIITSSEGLKRIEKEKKTSRGKVIIDVSLPSTRGDIIVPARKFSGTRGGPVIFSLGVFFEVFRPFPPDTFIEAIRRFGKSKEKNIEIFNEGMRWGRESLRR